MSRREKGTIHITDSLFERVNKKGCLDWTWESPSKLNVLYKSFHIHRNMSRFWSFPLISFRPNLALSLLTNGLTLHEVQELGGGWGCWIIFSSLQWPWPADWAIPFSLGQSGSAKPTVRAFGPGNPCFFILCLLQFSVNTTAGNLVGGAASCLWLHTWSQILTPGHRTLTTWQSKRKLNLWSFMGLASWNMNINVCGTWGQDIAVWIFRKLLTLGLLGEKKDTFLVLKLKSILLLHKLICLIRCSLLSCLTFILLQSTKYLVEAVH